jgi:hypothetical protein
MEFEIPKSRHLVARLPMQAWTFGRSRMSTKIDLEVTTSRLLEALEYTGFIRVGDTERYKLPQYSVPVPL